VYPTNQLTPSSWGFFADTTTVQTAENTEHREWFKTFLDEEQLRQAQARVQDKSDLPSSVEEVERW
jgi:hypothetical protein